MIVQIKYEVDDRLQFVFILSTSIYDENYFK